MFRKSLATVLALGLMTAAGAAWADDNASTTTKAETEAGAQATTDMPATEHQKEVLKGEVETKVESDANAPAMGGKTEEGMPETKHQEQVLDDDKEGEK